MLCGVSPQIRNEREIARTLDRRGQLTLMTRAGSAQAAGKDLPLISDESAERSVVLVVDPSHAAFAEWTAFLWSSHLGYSSSSSSSSRRAAAAAISSSLIAGAP